MLLKPLLKTMIPSSTQAFQHEGPPACQHLLSVPLLLTVHFKWTAHGSKTLFFSFGGLDRLLDLAVSVCLSKQETPALGQMPTHSR